ncbi:MAG TPA: UDP-N-acetylglucosamine 2-epimerase (non-hydrolyzing) [Planctomycetaceae bacterium]|nr:UDP-N-acetylglucosamine 2-epimerase (non-hydrolyzing) [Planctomycetaceae bacterium]
MRPLIIVGTRPEAIKLAPLILACRNHPSIQPIVCSTGQHRQMLDQVFSYFNIQPDIDLELMKANQTLANLTADCLTAIDRVITQHPIDRVVAQGDTTTVLAASMAAFYRQVPIVHVEAGLRTGDLRAPWPEEFNRRVTGLVASFHCAPTETAATALRGEGIAEASIRVTGNTVIDSLLITAKDQRQHQGKWLAKYPMIQDRPLVLITGHRRENYGDAIASICGAIGELAAAHPKVAFIYPVHLNPNIRGPVSELLCNVSNVHLVPPADYPEFVWLMDRAHVILTDSGGVQEEAPSLGVPVLVTREKTERPEAVESGLAELVGTDRKRIIDRVTSLLKKAKQSVASESPCPNPYGDGKASERIVQWMFEMDCKR